jgi:glycosidase
VEAEDRDKDSLLNTVRTLLKIRQQERCLQEGSLEILENLPKGVLGYARIFNGKKLLVLLNFDDREKELEIENSKKLLNLSARDQVKDKKVYLGGFGGLLLTTDKHG